MCVWGDGGVSGVCVGRGGVGRRGVYVWGWRGIRCVCGAGGRGRKEGCKMDSIFATLQNLTMM